MFCADGFEERAAIMQFCGGISRFQAETLAARAQGVSRWKALQLVKEAFDEPGAENSHQGGDHRQSMAREQGEDAMPKMQPRPKEEVRPFVDFHRELTRVFHRELTHL